jgi:hypothetical protein
MGWVGLHTSPNIDPHATICYWRIDDPVADEEHSNGVRAATAALVVSRRERGWRGTFPFVVNALAMFGAPSDPKQVALIQPAYGYEDQVTALLEHYRRWHVSQRDINPHVTAHGDRPFFEFKWVGLHLPGSVTYTRLTP